MEGVLNLETVTSIISLFGDIITAVIGWMGEVLTFITSNPVILIPMLMFFLVGGVIGLIMRILRG